MEFVDLFPDPAPPPSIGGNVVTAPLSSFPTALEQPESFRTATVTPFPEIASTLFAPLDNGDFIAAFFLAIALILGPDFILAPAGLVSEEGVRPGYSLEATVGSILTPDSQWLKDRKENLAADAPLTVRAPIFVLFFALGIVVNRFLLVALEDTGFVTSLGICACIGGGFLEIIRKPLPTRAERDLDLVLAEEFLVFSGERLAVGGRCHEREVVAAFRKFYPRYRSADMGRSKDGMSVPDDVIADQIRGWNAQMGRPGVRTSSGFWKGISVLEQQS